MRDLLPFVMGWAVRSAIAVSIAYTLCTVSQLAPTAVRNLAWRSCPAGTLFIALGLMFMPRLSVPVPITYPLARTNLEHPTRSMMTVDRQSGETTVPARTAIGPSGRASIPMTPSPRQGSIWWAVGIL
jgi:hypothetical protein